MSVTGIKVRTRAWVPWVPETRALVLAVAGVSGGWGRGTAQHTLPVGEKATQK